MFPRHIRKIKFLKWFSRMRIVGWNHKNTWRRKKILRRSEPSELGWPTLLKTLNRNMGRINKTIDGVFIDIVGSPTEISTYDQFIQHGGGLKSSKELDRATQLYQESIVMLKPSFERLAALEEIIMQMRIRENLEDIKLCLVREYIYARVPFYRKGTKSKDIRVIVDNLEFHPEATANLDILLGNETFMEKAKNKLIQAIDIEIAENIRNYKILYSTKKPK
jgi:hypothetical protein